jgi:small GTP-binding protein
MQALDGFNNARNDLLSAIAILARLAKARENDELVARCRSHADKLEQHRFNLAVLGEFKRGKSTLVNALIGADIMPAAVIPLTSITTTIRHGATISTTVHFAKEDKLEEKIDIASLTDFVTESGNPLNCKGVQSVTITYPCDLLAAGVEIIDTPGIGSANEHNTRTTRSYLPEIDAAIFLLSADQPATRAELDFLEEVRHHSARIFMAQNKIDYLSREELQQSLAYLKETVHCQTVYPLSAKLALKRRLQAGNPTKADNPTKASEPTIAGDAVAGDGVDQLEKDIRQFLSCEKGKTIIQTSVTRLRHEIGSVSALIRLEQHARSQPLAELQGAIAAFEKAASAIIQEESDTEFIVKGESNKLISAVEASLNAFAARHKEKLVASIEESFTANQKLGKADLIRALHQTLLSELTVIFDNWRATEEEAVSASFAAITRRSVERANDVIKQIQQAAKEHLGIAAAGHFEIAPLTNESRHRYAVDDPFTLAVESLPLLLPTILAKPVIHKRFLGAAANELSRNSGRLRADFQERINKTITEFLLNFRKQIVASQLEVQSTIERALQKRQQSAQECFEADRQLAEQLAAIDEIERLLVGAANQIDGTSDGINQS